MGEMSAPPVRPARRRRVWWPRWVWAAVALAVVGAGIVVGVRLMGGSAPTPTAGTTPQPTSSAMDTPTSSTAASEPPVSIVPEGWQVHPDAPFGLGGVAAWTGEELVVGAGACCATLAPPEIAAYNPATETWRDLPGHPVRCRAGDAAVWTGEDLIFVGGFTTPTCVMPGTNDPWTGIDSYALDVGSGTWRTLPPPPQAVRLVDHLVWTGSGVLALGRAGFDPTEPVLLLRYDPIAEAWDEPEALPGPARRDFAAVWTGEHLLVWGGSHQRSPWPEEQWMPSAGGWAYAPSSDTWTPITPAPLPGTNMPYATWTGTEMIIWGGATRGPELDEASTRGVAYDPSTDTWRVLADLPAEALPDRLSSPEPWSSVWTGTEFVLLIRGIAAQEWTTLFAAYNPSADTWRILPPTPLYNAVSTTWTGHSILLTGSLIDDVHGGPPGQRLVEYHPGPIHIRN